MAEKRMFHKKIVESDMFLDMPDSTQNLYFHLSMVADDDGFVDKPKSIMRMTGKKDDDLRLLISKQFIIPFESGVIVIRHWRINNYLRSDRYKETTYKDEKAQLSINKNGEYEFGIPCGIPLVDQVSTSDLDLDLDLDLDVNNINNKLLQRTHAREGYVENYMEGGVNPDNWGKEKTDAYKQKFLRFYEFQKDPHFVGLGDAVIHALVELERNAMIGTLKFKQYNYTLEGLKEALEKVDEEMFIKFVTTLSVADEVKNTDTYVWAIFFKKFFEGVANG